MDRGADPYYNGPAIYHEIYNCIDDKKEGIFRMFSNQGVWKINYDSLARKCFLTQNTGKITIHDRETCLGLIKYLKSSLCLTNTEKN